MGKGVKKVKSTADKPKKTEAKQEEVQVDSLTVQRKKESDKKIK